MLKNACWVEFKDLIFLLLFLGLIKGHSRGTIEIIRYCFKISGCKTKSLSISRFASVFLLVSTWVPFITFVCLFVCVISAADSSFKFAFWRLYRRYEMNLSILLFVPINTFLILLSGGNDASLLIQNHDYASKHHNKSSVKPGSFRLSRRGSVFGRSGFVLKVYQFLLLHFTSMAQKSWRWNSLLNFTQR